MFFFALVLCLVQFNSKYTTIKRQCETKSTSYFNFSKQCDRSNSKVNARCFFSHSKWTYTEQFEKCGNKCKHNNKSHGYRERKRPRIVCSAKANSMDDFPFSIFCALQWNFLLVAMLDFLLFFATPPLLSLFFPIVRSLSRTSFRFYLSVSAFAVCLKRK